MAFRPKVFPVFVNQRQKLNIAKPTNKPISCFHLKTFRSKTLFITTLAYKTYFSTRVNKLKRQNHSLQKKKKHDQKKVFRQNFLSIKIAFHYCNWICRILGEKSLQRDCRGFLKNGIVLGEILVFMPGMKRNLSRVNRRNWCLGTKALDKVGNLFAS